MKRLTAKIFLVFLCTLILFSCTAKRSCREIFEDYSRSYKALYSGALYTSEAREWEDGYISDELFSSLYDGADGKSERDRIEECAVYLSSSMESFCEVGIFLCYGNADAESVAKMCHRRIFLISETKKGEGYSYKENSSVMIFGRYVVYTIQPDKRASERAISVAFN